jgi:hypothetical protein
MRGYLREDPGNLKLSYGFPSAAALDTSEARSRMRLGARSPPGLTLPVGTEGAVAETVTEVPEPVAPLAGAVMEALRGVVSGAGGVASVATSVVLKALL